MFLVIFYRLNDILPTNLFYCFNISGLQKLEILVHIFRAPNNMFAYTIVHLTFRAPQVVVYARVYANKYLTLHLLQR